MSLYTEFCSKIAFPVHEWIKGHDTVATLARLEQSQWDDPRTQEQEQTARLRAFLGRIGTHVPYYRDLFAVRAFRPKQITSAGDLQALPLLDKSTIRDHFARLTSDQASRLSRLSTGGSTGEPLIFLAGKARRAHDVAAKWRATKWWGVDIGDREIVVWGSPVELQAQDHIKKARDTILRTELFPAFEMSEQKLDAFIARVRSRRPAMLFGYPSALALIAEYAQRHGARLDNLGIQVAFVTSERLYNHQRAIIARTFSCPVANGYGGRDAGFVSHECPAGGMHISAEDIIVEIVDPAGQPVPSGQMGEIVVTHMATADFPFVRYRTGDIASIDPMPCTCGRGLPLLKEIQGRSTDFVVASDGKIMHGLALIYPVRDIPGVRQFKIIQHDLLTTELQLVVSPEFNVEQRQRLAQNFRARLGAQVSINIEIVDRIEPERSGKYRYVVSHVEKAASHA